MSPGADRLEGEAWLRFLDGEQGRAFSEGPGRLLLDGGYRRTVGAPELEAALEADELPYLPSESVVMPGSSEVMLVVKI